MTTSSGAEHSEREFLERKKRGESVMSAMRPSVKVRAARVRPMMVRYCQCQPLGVVC